MTYPRHTLVKPAPLAVGERVLDLQIFRNLGEKVVGIIGELFDVDGVQHALVYGGPPETRWSVVDDVTRWRRALDSEVAS